MTSARKPGSKARPDNVVDLPAAATSRERHVPGMPQLTYQPGVGVWREANGGEPKLMLSWCPTVLRHLVSYSPRGEITSRQVTIQVGEITATVTTKDVADGAVWRDRFLGVAGSAGKDMREALTNIVDDQAGRLAPISAHPVWTGDWLMLPPADVLPRGYTETAGAPEDFAAILRGVLDAPKIALLMGAAVGGLYVSPLRMQSCIWHLAGRGRMGKTTAMVAAGSIFGNPGTPAAPDGVILPWNTTGLGPTVWLQKLRVLTGFRDDLGAAKYSPAQLSSLVFQITQGAERDASTRTQQHREAQAGWHGVLISTGNVGIVSHIANEGIAARVMEISAPITESGAQSRAIESLIRNGYGHGITAIIERAMPPAEFRELIDAAGVALPLPDGGVERTLGEHVALAVAGARLLGEVFGVPELADAAMEAGRTLHADLSAALVERGVDPGERLLRAIAGAMASSPSLFPTRGDYERAEATDRPLRDIIGWDLSTESLPGDVAIIQTKITSITDPVGIEDPNIALRELRDRKLLIPDGDKRHLAKQVKVGGKKPRAYVIKGVHDDAAPETAPESAPEPPVTPAPVDDTPAPALEPQRPTQPGGNTVGDTMEPCDLCGKPTAGRVDGIPRHLMVGGVRCPKPKPDPGPEPEPAAQRAERRPIVGRAKPNPRAPELPPESELANFAALLRVGEPGVWAPEPDAAELAAGLDLFHRVTDQLRVETRSAGRMGILTFYRLSKRAGTPSPVAVELPEPLAGIRPKMLAPHWVNPDRVPIIGGPDLIGLDVNGQFLAASGMELGTGQPRQLGPVSAADMLSVGGKFREIPGYGQLAGPIDAHGIWRTLDAGDWLAAPTLRYLADDLGLHVPLSDAWIWDEHRRWLGNFYTFWRDARAALLDSDAPGARLALAAVKSIPNTFIGGWMRSTEHNHTVTLRPDWAHQVIARSRVNALRGIGKASAEPVAIVADTAYFLGRDDARGMQISTTAQLGKWKVERTAPVTKAIVSAHQRGRAGLFRDAVNASCEAGKGEQ